LGLIGATIYGGVKIIDKIFGDKVRKNPKGGTKKTYTIYRAIFADSIEDIDFENLGQSFAQDASLAEKFAKGRKAVSTIKNYFLIEAKVTTNQIDIAQTNGQWESEYSEEGEVVLESHQKIMITVYQDNEKITSLNANTGYHRDENDETRAEPISCNATAVTDYLN
jgi:hypothetical protein